jgi:2-(1,2-epoxy-1,2-dihydrophenyl)acetyl-CoA isomerase
LNQTSIKKGGSVDKVELAQRLYTALSQGYGAAVADLLCPEFQGRTAAGLPLGLGGEYVGAEDMRDNFWWAIGRHFRAEAEPEEFLDLADGRLLVSGTYKGAGRRSGRKLEAAFTHVIGFKQGRIASLVQLTDTAAWHDALGESPSVEVEPAAVTGQLTRFEYAVEQGVARIVLNRPGSNNAIDLPLAEEFLTLARAIRADPRVRAVLISGNGPSLTVGGDLPFIVEAGGEDLGSLLRRMTTPFHEAFQILSEIEAPIVTAAHGAIAGGGLGFVYAADVVIASRNARFVTAFADVGVSGDGGGTWHLPRLIGTARATRVMLENRPISASEALEWGLVSEVVDDDAVLETALALATRLAAGPTRAYAHMRRLLREGATSDLAGQLRAETEAVVSCGSTTDTRNAMAAFVAGRRPTFKGH